MAATLLPVVDLDTMPLASAAECFRDACTKHGFFYLKGAHPLSSLHPTFAVDFNPASQ